MQRSGKIWSIVLAAGESKRMGSPKMLLRFGEKTMLETVLEHVAGSIADGILVVLGANSGLLRSLPGILGVSYCINEDYTSGMLSSVQCGFRNLPAYCDAVLVFQGDQPYILPAQVNLLIGEYRQGGKGILIPTAGGKRGHPILIDMKYREEVFSLDSSKGLRQLTVIHSDDVAEVETGAAGILKDIDTPEDYMEMINQTQ